MRLKRVLNPQSWFDGSTYLRAETEAIEDTDSEVDAWQLEGEAPRHELESLKKTMKNVRKTMENH